MHRHYRLLISILLFSSFLLPACGQDKAAPSSSESRDTLSQVSTIDSLMAGNYDGIETAEQIFTKGDFGIGTFDGLDGEMVMLNGIVYQVEDSGMVTLPENGITLPFAAVTYFDTDVSQAVGQVQDLDTLKNMLDQMIVKKDRFYAIRIDGTFSTIEVRSVPKQQKPYPILSEVTKNQPIFNYESVNGSLIGFWCPEYVGSVNVPGYHLHFISDDRSKGGHLLNVSISSATIALDETRFFAMELGENSLSGSEIIDAQGEMDKVEK